jgi:MFS family permease
LTLYYGWILLAGLSVSEMVSWGVLYYAFAAFLQPMEVEHGWTRAQTAGAFSLGLVATALAGPFVGRYIDRRGPRLLMTLGSCAGVALVFAWARVHTLAGLYAVWFGMGLAMAAVLYEPAFAVITIWFSRERDRALTILVLVTGLSSAVFVPLAGRLTEQLGWRPAVTVLAMILAVTIPIHGLLLRRNPAELGLYPDGAPSAPIAAASTPDVSWGDALKTLAFWSFALAFAFGGLAAAAVGVHLIPYLTERGYSPATSAVVVGLIGAMMLPGRLAFQPLSRRLPRRWVAASVFLLQGVSLAALPFLASSTAGLGAFVVAFGMASGLMTISRATSVAEVFGLSNYGSIGGTVGSLTIGARALGPIAAAWLYAAFGSYDPVLWLIAVGLLLAGAAALAR